MKPNKNIDNEQFEFFAKHDKIKNYQSDNLYPYDLGGFKSHFKG